jgi:hypothetical protein
LDPAVLGGIEAVKLLLQAAFEVARLLKADKEALAKAYAEELAKFLANDPAKLPEV